MLDLMTDLIIMQDTMSETLKQTLFADEQIFLGCTGNRESKHNPSQWQSVYKVFGSSSVKGNYLRECANCDKWQGEIFDYGLTPFASLSTVQSWFFPDPFPDQGLG